MELVPVPGSGSEMILDHHLAFNVALECVVPNIEIEKKTLQQKRSNNNDPAKTLINLFACVIVSMLRAIITVSMLQQP